MSNTPSDAEIDEVTLDVLGYAALDKETNETARMIARAVLAKWGTPPAVAGEPFGYSHQLLDHEGNGNGVWLGTARREVTEQAHTPGETSEEIVTLYTAPQPSTTAQAAESVPAEEREKERIAFKDAHRHLELDEVPDAWGRPMFKHSHVETSWLGWIARAARAPADSDLITIRKPTTQAEVVWLAKLAHLLVSDVNYTLGAMLEPKADSVQEDAARWNAWASGIVEACNSDEQEPAFLVALNKAIGDAEPPVTLELLNAWTDAARKQGDTP